VVSGRAPLQDRALFLAFAIASSVSAAGCGGQTVGGAPGGGAGGAPGGTDARPADTRPAPGGPDSGATAPDAGSIEPDGGVPGGPLDGGNVDGGADASSDVAPEAGGPQVAAQGIRVGLVEGSQSVFIKLGEGTTMVAPAMRNADLIEGRPMFLRVHLVPLPGFTARVLLGVLTVNNAEGAPVLLEDRKMIAGPSNPEKLETTFNFLIPAAQVTPTTRVSAAIYEGAPVGASENAEATPRFPATGELALGVKAGKMVLDVVMVPAVGPGGTVDDAPARRKRVEDHLYDVYPVQKANVRWREPLRFTARTSASAGFRALVDARTKDAAPVGTYYHLLLATEDSTEGYLGIANLAGATAGDGPRRIGITFVTGRKVDSLLDTISHEMGHNHGRNHAPGCNAQGVDMAFPYVPGPGVGVNGYSLSESILKVARLHKDLMGYCNVTWVSDYTWKGFERRVRAVSALPAGPAMALQTAETGPVAPPRRTLLGFVSPDGTPEWTTVDGALTGDAAVGNAQVSLAGGPRTTVLSPVSIRTLSDDRTREIAVVLPAGAPQQVSLTIDGRQHTVDLDRLAR
jgi:hypothetical protein